MEMAVTRYYLNRYIEHQGELQKWRAIMTATLGWRECFKTPGYLLLFFIMHLGEIMLPPTHMAIVFHDQQI